MRASIRGCREFVKRACSPRLTNRIHGLEVRHTPSFSSDGTFANINRKAGYFAEKACRSGRNVTSILVVDNNFVVIIVAFQIDNRLVDNLNFVGLDQISIIIVQWNDVVNYFEFVFTR